jgi:beta-lactam-binding protein with PASTA domain
VAIAYQHVRENPIPPSRVDPELPSWADPITLRAMAKDPADRYQSAAEMRNDIQRALSGYPVGGQMRQASTYAGGPGTRRLDPLGQTQLQGQTGAIPPYQYGPPGNGNGHGAPPQRRRPVWPWVTGLVVLIVIAALVLAYETISGHGTPPGVTVPSVVGSKLAAAETTLEKDGFKVNAVAKPSATGPYDVVTATSPAGTSLAPKGSTVTVDYYAQPGAKTVPTVRGMSEAAASAKLNGAGFSVVTTSPTPVASLTIPSGSVVSTTPAAGTKVSLSTDIVLNLSGGGEKVPSVDDLAASDAESELRSANLVPNVINNQSGPPGATPGTVWQTTPIAGKVVLPGSTVTIYVVPGSTSPSSSPSSTPSSSPSSSSSPSPSPTSSSPTPALSSLARPGRTHWRDQI